MTTKEEKQAEILEELKVIAVDGIVPPSRAIRNLAGRCYKWFGGFGIALEVAGLQTAWT